MTLVVRPDQLVVSVTTANFIFSDWNNKTNGVWTGKFPHKRLQAQAAAAAASPFETDLLEYYEGVRAIGISPPAAWSPQGASESWRALTLAFLRQYDCSAASARLVSSLPGRHSGAALEQWGHMRMRKLLDEQIALGLQERKFDNAPLLLQFSCAVWLVSIPRTLLAAASAPVALLLLLCSP